MGFYEDKRDGVAYTLISRYGATLSIGVTSGETFNPMTGASSGGTTDWFPAYGVILPDQKGEKTQTGIRTSNLNVMVAASGLEVVPAVNHRLQIGTNEYEIIRVVPLRPGGIDVLYEIEARMP